MSQRTDIHKVLIIGSGPIIIGQACEFDYSGTQACKALRSLGYEIVLVNSNPATIMTDPEMADVTYIEPLNVERLEQIIEKERPDALLPNLGGQSGLNLCAELAQAGVLGFTSHGVLRALGYANPHAAGMSATAEAVVASVKKMASLEIEMGAARGSDGEPRLSAIPRSRLFCCSASTLGASGGLTLAPPDAKQPLSAIPLALRACECKQVIPIEPGQMPDFSGRRVSAAQRQMALYLVARALEKKTSKSVLVSTMLRDLGVSFGRGDAGRQARSRALRQLIKTLDAMAAQGAVIDGYEIESVRGRTRAIVLHPVRSQTTDN